MTTAVPARRAWWKKKRWAAAGVMLLEAGSPASAGPAIFAASLGWPGARYAMPVVRPLITPSFMTGPLGPGYGRYLMWWVEKAGWMRGR